MRLIGHLPNEASALTFRDFLIVEGITNEVESDTDGWGVWIHSEDELKRASRLLEEFRSNPNQSRFVNRGREAQAHLKEEAEVQEARDRRIQGRKQVFRSTLPYGAGPLTVLLIGLSAAASLMFWMDQSGEVARALQISTHPRGLLEVRRGEIWRLLTPIFLHGNRHDMWLSIFHLVFNMQWLLDLGSMIEARRSSKSLGLMVLVIGVISNLAQYQYAGPNFVGMSGVVYGLLGYVWMKGKYDPASGLGLHPQTVTLMLVWFVLCFTPLIPNVANTCHAAGLALGVIWGLGSSLLSVRRR